MSDYPNTQRLAELRQVLLKSLAEGSIDAALIVSTITELEEIGMSVRSDEEYMSRMLG